MYYASLMSHRLNLADLVEAVIEQGATIRFQAAGQSMIPCIHNEDSITIAPMGEVEPGLGEIIAVLTDAETLVVHRVVRILPTAVVVRGDNSLCSDGPIPRSRILGRVIRIEREGRTLRWGLGPERRLFALLTRFGMLYRWRRQRARLPFSSFQQIEL